MLHISNADRKQFAVFTRNLFHWSHSDMKSFQNLNSSNIYELIWYHTASLLDGLCCRFSFNWMKKTVYPRMTRDNIGQHLQDVVSLFKNSEAKSKQHNSQIESLELGCFWWSLTAFWVLLQGSLWKAFCSAPTKHVVHAFPGKLFDTPLENKLPMKSGAMSPSSPISHQNISTHHCPSGTGGAGASSLHGPPLRAAGAGAGARQEERQRQNVTVSRFGERMGPGNVTGNDGDMGIKLICPTQIRDWNGLTYQKLWIRLWLTD